MQDRLKKIIQLIIFISFGIFFVWISIKDLTPEEWQAIKESALAVNNFKSWVFLFLSMFAGICAHYFRAIRSILLLEPLNYKIRKSMSFYSVMVGYFANLALPRIGEVLRCTFLQRYEKVPFQKALGTVVTERVIDMFIWVVCLVIVIFMNTSVLSNLIVDKANNLSLGVWMQEKSMSVLQNHTLYFLLAGLILLCLLVYFTRKWWMKIPFLVKIRDIFIGAWQGLISIKDVKYPFLFVFYTLMIWVCFFFGTYLCFFAFDYLVPLGPLPAFSVLIFGTIGFMVAQGGLGAYPLMVAGILVLYGIDYNAGLAAGWIGWTAQTVMIIIVGLVSLILASLASRNEKSHITNISDESCKTN